ncbi:MAG TPA: hypothetical protein VF058_01420 [Actinomycetota bacterium]
MIEAGTPVAWGEGLVWLGGVIAAGFLISWALTDLLRMHRALYVGLLTLLAWGLTIGYVLRTGSGVTFWVERWPWGLLGALVAGAFLAMMVSRRPAEREADRMGPGDALWEGVVYGSAEGLLLSVLPVLITWQLLGALGWGDAWRGLAALAASVVVIVAHHLGYPEYRGRTIVSPVIGCAVLSIAYLATGSPIAAIGGHIVLHLAMRLRGMELPPHTESVLGRDRAGGTLAGARSG